MLVGFDVETDILNGEDRKVAPPLVCYSTSDPEHPLQRWDEKEFLFKLWHAAAYENITIIGHNIAYDTVVICAQYPEIIPLVFAAYKADHVIDTQLQEMLLTLESIGDTQKVSLAKLAEQYCQKTLDKGEDSWRMRYGELRHVPLVDWPERAKVYAIEDSTILLKINEKQRKRAKHKNTFDNGPARARIAFAAQLMSAWGLKADVDRVAQYTDEIAVEQKILHEYLQCTTMMRKDGSVNTKALAAHIKTLGYIIPRTDAGNDSLKAEFLETIDDSVVCKYVQYKRNHKLVSTYLNKYTSGLIHCVPNPLLKNGRVSLAKPSLQNLPARGDKAKIREVFIPREGNVFCSVDFDGVELRTFAQHCLDRFGVSKLASIYQADPTADVPSMEGAALAGISADEGVARRKAGDPTFKQFRNGAKAALYGFHGGMGAATFVKAQAMQGNTFTLAEAEKLKAQHFAWLPEVALFFKHIQNDHYWSMKYVPVLKKSIKVADSVTTRTHRHRGQLGWSQLSNEKFSAPMADGAGEAFFDLADAMYNQPEHVLFGARTVCYVHDETIMEFARDGAHEQAQAASEIMCAAMHRHTPDIPITAGPALMTRWFKGAEEKFENGRLVPWK